MSGSRRADSLAVARLVCLLFAATAVHGAEVTRAARWELHNSFWMNLHQTLMHDATAKTPRDTAALSGEHRSAWEAAVTAYREAGGTGSITFARPMVVTQDELTQLADDAVNGTLLRGPLAGALRQAAPVYRAHWWASDQTANRFFIAYAAAMLRDAGEELALAHESVYREKMPQTIRVDVTAYAGQFGAYSHSLRNGGFTVSVSSRDSGNHGFAALEILMHESSHALVSPRQGTVAKAIAEAAAAAGIEPPRDLWHAVLFATSSELTRRALHARGATQYVPFSEDLFTRVWPRYREGVETFWYPYLSGRGTLEDAIAKVVKGVR